MNKQEFLDKYFPDYKEKGLSEPKFYEGDYVRLIQDGDTGVVFDVDTTEKQRPSDAPIEWRYILRLSSYGVASVFENEIELQKDESIK
jgi:hypothetical protein